MTRRIPVVLVAITIALAGLTACGSDDAGDADASTVDVTPAPASSSTTTTTTTAPPASTPPPTTVPSTTLLDVPPTTKAPTIQAAPATSAPPPVAPTEAPRPPAPTGPPYQSSVAIIDDATRARMTHSWRPECPVPLEDLRLVTVRHWNEAGNVATGEIVVHADSADAIAKVFGDLYAAGFPIARMQLVDAYGGDDGASMRANNTSAFNCRAVAGTNTWSQHSYGRAVDVNPLVNPWVRGGSVDPPEGRAYADRRNQVPGGIYAGDAVVQAFASIGWKWGGYWSSAKDYQHFSANGR